MIREIIESQKRELESSSKMRYVPRRIEAAPINNRLIKVIIGPRRAGKSFYAQHYASTSGEFAYLNFDDERLVGIDNYDDLTTQAMALNNGTDLFLLDEIQNMPRWELWVNRLQREGFRLILTGSNAHLLSSELSTHITGRYEQIVIFPFSFEEYSDAVTENKRLSVAEEKAILGNYLHRGGFPETVVCSVNHREYLKTLLQSTIYKDIVKRYRITTAAGIENLAKYLLSNTGSEYSFRSLTHVVGCKSDMTVRKYLRFLEEAFMLFSVPRFSFKVREQVTQNKKIFAVDNGLICAAGFTFSPDAGRLAENAVAIRLETKRLCNKLQYFFWKNTQHEEVDFVCMENRRVTRCIQVCWNISNPQSLNREIRALLKAGRELGCDMLQVINEDKEAEEIFRWGDMAGKVVFIPLWKWLLQEK